MNFVDRQPRYPGRVKIEPESGGSSFFATISRADEATVAGTPINATTLSDLYNDRAPAGHGLGVVQWIDTEDIDEITATGIYSFTAANTSPNKPCTHGELIHIQRNGDVTTQLVIDDNFGNPLVFIRKKTGGKYNDWREIVPRMVLGREYRTTELYKTAIVYTKLISFGALPQSSSKNVNHNIEDFGELVDVRGNVVDSSGTTWYDLQSGGGGTVSDVYVSTTQVTIVTNGSHDLGTCYVMLKYTKSS